MQTAYSATLQPSGSTTPYTWSVASGTLPAGLNLAASDNIAMEVEKAGKTWKDLVETGNGCGP